MLKKLLRTTALITAITFSAESCLLACPTKPSPNYTQKLRSRAAPAQEANSALRPVRRAEAPAPQTTIDYLIEHGIPKKAIQWVANKYGWPEEGESWQASFLPVQESGIREGLCDPKKKLYQSGTIAAPTSSGKTLLAELRMLARHFNQDNKPARTVYLAPTRALAAQKFEELRRAYGAETKEGGLEICYSSGDEWSQDEQIRNSGFDIAVMVNEKLAEFMGRPDFLRGVGEVVFDEAGTMSDPKRGVFLETAMTACVRGHDDISVLAMGRPSKGYERLRRTMRYKRKEAFSIETDKRPIDIEIGVWAPVSKETTFMNCNTGQKAAIPREEFDLSPKGNLKSSLKQIVMKFLDTGQSDSADALGMRNNCAVTVPTRQMAMAISDMFGQLYDEDEEVRRVIDRNKNREFAFQDRLSSLEDTTRKRRLAGAPEQEGNGLLGRGIGFHISDLTPEERELVEDAFLQGELPLLVCTATLAEGVNLPMQNMVFMRWGERLRGRQTINEAGEQIDIPGETYYEKFNLKRIFRNWYGRVGRVGMAGGAKPTVVYMCFQGDENSQEYKDVWGWIEQEEEEFTTHLADTSLEQPVLTAIMALTNEKGRAPTFSEIEEFFHTTPSAVDDEARAELSRRALRALRRLGNLKLQDEYLAAKTILDASFMMAEKKDQEEMISLEEGQVSELLYCIGKLRQSFPAEAVETRRRFTGITEAMWGHIQKQIMKKAETKDHLKGILQPVKKELLAIARAEQREFSLSWGIGECEFSKAALKQFKAMFDEAEFTACFLQTDENAGRQTLLVDTKIDQGHARFRLTKLGKVGHSYGICQETAGQMHSWFSNYACGRPQPMWDALDMLTLAMRISAEDRVAPFYARASHDGLKAKLAAHIEEAGERLKEDWREASPLVKTLDFLTTSEMATLLAMRDWMRGIPIVDIETEYGLREGSLYAKGREFARIIRAFSAVAARMPKDTFPHMRPQSAPPLKSMAVSAPHDLDALGEQLLYGMPHEAIGLAHLGVEGLNRQHIMNIYEAVEQKKIAEAAHIVERTRLLSRKTKSWRLAIPLQGLRVRAERAIKDWGMGPLAANLIEDPRGETPSLREEFYSRLFIRWTQLVQAAAPEGTRRATALKVVSRDGAWTFYKRRIHARSPDPIEITADEGAQKQSENLSHWLKRGAIEFLSEITIARGEEYVTDRFFVDLDPKDGYGLGQMKNMARHIARVFAQRQDVENVQVRWTGGKGFHIIGKFKQGDYRPVNEVHSALEEILKRYCDDDMVFLRDHPDYDGPRLILDLSPVMKRGAPRNVFSINAASGMVCVPVEITRLDEFDPGFESDPETVMRAVDRMDITESMGYEEMLEEYFRCMRLECTERNKETSLTDIVPEQPQNNLARHCSTLRQVREAESAKRTPLGTSMMFRFDPDACAKRLVAGFFRRRWAFGWLKELTGNVELPLYWGSHFMDDSPSHSVLSRNPGLMEYINAAVERLFGAQEPEVTVRRLIKAGVSGLRLVTGVRLHRGAREEFPRDTGVLAERLIRNFCFYSEDAFAAGPVRLPINRTSLLLDNYAAEKILSKDDELVAGINDAIAAMFAAATLSPDIAEIKRRGITGIEIIKVPRENEALALTVALLEAISKHTNPNMLGFHQNGRLGLNYSAAAGLLRPLVSRTSLVNNPVLVPGMNSAIYNAFNYPKPTYKPGSKTYRCWLLVQGLKENGITDIHIVRDRRGSKRPNDPAGLAERLLSELLYGYPAESIHSPVLQILSRNPALAKEVRQLLTEAFDGDEPDLHKNPLAYAIWDTARRAKDNGFTLAVIKAMLSLEMEKRPHERSGKGQDPELPPPPISAAAYVNGAASRSLLRPIRGAEAEQAPAKGADFFVYAGL